MAVTYVQLPVGQNLPDFDFQTTLSGVRYQLRMRFNLRMQRWILDIADAANQPILMGIPVLIRRDLTGQYPTLSLPPGQLFCADLSGQELQATDASFQTDHALIYGDPTT